MIITNKYPPFVLNLYNNYNGFVGTCTSLENVQSCILQITEQKLEGYYFTDSEKVYPIDAKMGIIKDFKPQSDYTNLCLHTMKAGLKNRKK